MADELKDKDPKKGGNFDVSVGDNGTMYADAEEDEGGGILAILIVMLIVIIWLAILCLLVKLDVGGFGSEVLYPVLKDVPVLQNILPDNIDEELEEDGYESMEDAIAEITRLKAQIEHLEKEKGGSTSDEEVEKMQEEIKRLQTFEASQVEFQKLKTEFYEEIVFGENAPALEEYKKYYEELDPDSAEYIYRQVVKQLETDGELDDYVKAYSEMKPKQAAAIFEMMPDNLDLVAKILGKMGASERAKILGAMDAKVSSQITKIMDPDY